MRRCAPTMGLRRPEALASRNAATWGSFWGPIQSRFEGNSKVWGGDTDTYTLEFMQAPLVF